MSEAQSLGMRLLRKKPIETLMSDTAGADPEHGHLKRGITPFQLTMFGVGSTIGTGIFFVLAHTVPTAGPAVILSFALAGVTAGLTALCYAEMASMIPVSGSSYSYAYATLGEGVAFFVASCLILEYGISAAAVAVGWSGYLNKLLETRPRLGAAAGPALGALGGGRLQPLHRRRWRDQSAGRHPGLHVLPAADPRVQGIGQSQRHHGPDQDGRAGHVHRDRASPASPPRTCNRSRRTDSRASAQRPAPSSSPMSASTPSRRRAKRSRTPSATCRSRSSPPWSS